MMGQGLFGLKHNVQSHLFLVLILVLLGVGKETHPGRLAPVALVALELHVPPVVLLQQAVLPHQGFCPDYCEKTQDSSCSNHHIGRLYPSPRLCLVHLSLGHILGNRLDVGVVLVVNQDQLVQFVWPVGNIF